VRAPLDLDYHRSQLDRARRYMRRAGPMTELQVARYEFELRVVDVWLASPPESWGEGEQAKRILDNHRCLHDHNLAWLQASRELTIASTLGEALDKVCRQTPDNQTDDQTNPEDLELGS
jgi:hypothetical protein